MRIVQYNDTYEEVGGTETYCTDLLYHLSQQGHEVFWLANGEGKARKDNHILLPPSKGSFQSLRSKYFFNPSKYKEFRSALAQIQPDVIHLHHNRYHTYELFRALAELKIPVVQTIHDYTILCPSQYYPQPYFNNAKVCDRGACSVICSQNKCVPMSRRFFYPFLHDKKRAIVRQKIQTFIAPSQKIKTYLERADFQNVIHLPFYMDTEQWTFNSERKVKNQLLFVGRVESNKGIHVLVDAVVNVQKTIPDIQLMIIGNGSQVEILRERKGQENLDCIELLGIVPHAVIKTYFEKANLCIVPTLDMEQFGLVGIEALASGTAVIGSNRGGIPDWCVDGVTGLLFEPNQKGNLEEKIIQLLHNDMLRLQLVQNGMRHIKNTYPLEKHFQNLLKIYKKARPLKE